MERSSRQNLIDILDDIESQQRKPYLWPWYHQVIRALVQEIDGTSLTWIRLKPRIATALKISGKISAIKLYRDSVKCGIREAKEVIEALMIVPAQAWDKVIIEFYATKPYISAIKFSSPQKKTASKVKKPKPRLRHRQKPKSKKRVVGRATGGGLLLNKGK